ncbi:MAG: dihydrofolate reductase family protein [Beduini sp.]|uniref:dihydrofolate reductase family protein n=1 Tax=Beduini sp. TaxID=1922300 RepID=UPI0039A25BC9
MRETVLYIAMSLDGFIADHEGKVDWLVGDQSCDLEETSYGEFIKTIDTVILGHTTYHQIATELSPDNWPYEGKQTYVFTHHNYPLQPEIKFINERDISVFIDELKHQEGKDIWICGGASIVTQCLKNDRIDRLHLTLIPCLLGKGVRLFEDQEQMKRFKLISNSNFNGMVDIVYERIREN